MTTLARVLAGLAVAGLGIYVFAASQGCASMGDACRNTGSVMGIFLGITLMVGGVVLMGGQKSLDMLAEQQRKARQQQKPGKHYHHHW